MIKTITFHIKNDMGLNFPTLSCLGHFQRNYQDYNYLSCVHCTSPTNETKWHGSTPIPFIIVCRPFDGSTFLSKICKVPLSYTTTCRAMIYYIFRRYSMTCACVHLGFLDHPMKDGEYQDIKE